MTITLSLKEPNADAFYNMLLQQVDRMQAHHKDSGGPGVWIEKEDDHLYEWQNPDIHRGPAGWLYQVLVYVDQSDVSMELYETPDDFYQSGSYQFDITPFTHRIYEAGIRVDIEYDPSRDIPEQVRVFLELLKPMELAWGGVFAQLADKYPGLDGLTRQVDPSWKQPESTTSQRPGWFPKPGDTFKKWQRAYAVIVDRREKYREIALDNQDEGSSPLIDDLRDAIFGDLPKDYKKKPSPSTVGRIMKAGDNDWLK